MTRISLPLTLAALAFAAPAFAAITDADGDGMYSFEEVLAAYPALTEETFNAIDGDGDGALSPEEVAAAEQAGILVSEG